MPLFIAFLSLLSIVFIFLLILSKKEKEKIEFFHVMAHRFRSPIAIIKWYTELFSDKSVGNLNEKQKEYLTQINRATEKLNETIDSLIILLQLQSNNLTIKIDSVNIKNLFAQIIQKLQFTIERHKLHLQETYPKDKEIEVKTDPKLLGIALQNIIENAIKYTPENGNIEIKVDILNKRLLIEIKDTGYGIPKERKSRVLADYVSFKDMGFSLYLVKLILKKIRAHVNFKSDEKRGTTFYISLPA